MKKFILIPIIFFGLISVSACGSALQENEAIRANNCALIADWNIAYNKALNTLNTYQGYSLAEDLLWGKVQEGDKSYDALMELRKLHYAQNYFTVPEIGVKITEKNYSTYQVDSSDSIYNADKSWKIIEEVRGSCPTFPKEYLADLFAGVLSFDSRYGK